MTSSENFDSIGKAAHVCVRCEEVFSDGDLFHSCIVRDPEVGFRREDFCGTCWSEGGHESLASWKSRRRDSAPPPPPPPDDELLLDLLERLIQDGRPEDEAFCYLLGVYLLRRKIVLLEGTQDLEGGKKGLRLRPRKASDRQEYLVLERPFTASEMEKAEAECERILAGRVEAKSA